MLKQFSTDDLDIKEEILDEPLNNRTSATTSTPTPIEPEIEPKTEKVKTEISHELLHISPSDPLPEFYARKEFKSDVLKFENCDDSSPKFSIEMDSKALSEKLK